MQRELFQTQHLGLSPRLQRAKLRQLANEWRSGTVARTAKGKLRKGTGYDRVVVKSRQRERTKAEREAADRGGRVYQKRGMR